MPDDPRHGVPILPLGDTSLLIQLGTSIDSDTHERVRAAFESLAAAAIPGVYDVVPAYTGVAVHYDPASFDATTDETPYDRAERVVRAVIENATSSTHAARDIIEIRVHYGGDAGPDLEHVARHAGLSTDDVIRLHASAKYRVYMIGFSPGFPYLGGLPSQLATPRRATPRSSVPAGSVGIAGEQTGIYSLSTPGGWQIIGRTEMQLFRPDLDPPTLLRIGDLVRFVAV